MWAMIVKEFRQLRRDRRTLAMMIVMPVVLLIVFGYAASFDVTTIPTVAAGPEAGQVAHLVGEPFQVIATEPSQGRAWAEEQLRDGNAAVAVVTAAGAHYRANAPQHRMSALQDVEAGRPLEVNETLGYARAKAHELGLELPLVECFERLIAAIDRTRRDVTEAAG